MGLLSRIKQTFSKLKTKITGSGSRADFVAGKTNEAHYFDKWGREWFLYRDPKDPTQTAYRVVKNSKVIKEGHTPNIAALDANGIPEKAPEAMPKIAPKLIQARKEAAGRIKSQETGAKIKHGLINFGEEFQIDSKALAKIKKMNPSALEEMYIWGEVLFEAYYNYDDLEDGAYGGYAGDTKNSQVWELVNAYEEKYGVL